MNVSGTLKKTKFLSEETGFCVLQFTKDDGTSFIAKGKMGHQYSGYKLDMIGRWVPNPKGGGQVFEVSHYTVQQPETEEGIYLFLTSGIFKGISKKIARALVDEYGEKTLSLMSSDINVVMTVGGVGPATFIKIRNSYQDAKPKQERVFELMNTYGFIFTEATAIVERFPENALNIIKNAPYSMCRRLDKIPFVKFDQIIIASGRDITDPQRIREVILHQLKNCYREGHTLLTRNEVMSAASRYLKIDYYLIENELQYLIDKRRLFVSSSPRGDLLQSRWFYSTEKEIANRLSIIESTPAEKALTFNPDDPRLENLKQHQRRAIVAPFYSKVSIITGRPGAGKTTLLRTLLDLLEDQNLSVLAVSPTGKAAQRLREVTSRDCSTIHRALGATHLSDEFLFNDLRTLDVDVILVDETSMLDTSILKALLRAAAFTTRIVLIGDVEQLPSVGPGAVFRDLIDSKCFAVYWLTQVLRITKADGSLPTPLAVSNGVREGKFINPPNDDEWAFYPTLNNNQTIEKVREVIANLRAEGVGYNDVQVFAPVNEGDMGVNTLNYVVKQCFYPDGKNEIEVDDKVMQRENNYDLDVYNGDIGIVREIYSETLNAKKRSADDPVMLAEMGTKLVEYTKKDLYHLTLAYTITGHKSQGSEYPHVIIVIPDNHIMMMDRYWFYTLITRCQKKAHVIGNMKVIQQTVKSRRSHERRTLLMEKLHKFLPQTGIEHK